MGPINALSTLWPAGKSGRSYTFIICFAPWLVKEHPRPFRFAAGKIPALSPSVSPAPPIRPPHSAPRIFALFVSAPLPAVGASGLSRPPAAGGSCGSGQRVAFFTLSQWILFPFCRASWGAQSDDVASSIPSQTRAKIGPSSSPVLNAESFRITIVYLGCSAG